MDKKNKVLKVEAYTMPNKLIISSETFSCSSLQTHRDDEVTIVIKGDIKNPVKINKEIKVILYYINGNRIQYNTRVDLCTTYQLNALLRGDSVILEERRRYYKLKINLQAKIILVMNEQKEIILDEEVPVLIKDINIGGVFIECKGNQFKKDDYVNLDINLRGRKMVLLAKVLRIQELEDDNYGYGCCFIHIKMRHEEMIAQYINQIQRERMDEIKLKKKNR